MDTLSSAALAKLPPTVSPLGLSSRVLLLTESRFCISTFTTSPLEVTGSASINGTFSNATPSLAVSLLQNVLINKKSHNNLYNPNNFNKILIKKLNYFKRNYNKFEIENILLKLREIDMKLKTTNTKEKLLFHPFFTAICTDIYA